MTLKDDVAYEILQKMRNARKVEAINNPKLPYDNHYEIAALETALTWYERANGKHTGK